MTFIQPWVRTLLIWAGLVLGWLVNRGIVGYGEPYNVVEGDWVYTYRDPLEYMWLLYLLAFVLTLTGCYIWTRLKDRHWVFLLWGILTPVGLFGISLLKDRRGSIKGGDATVKVQMNILD